MKNIKHSSTTDRNQKPSPTAHAWTPKSLAMIRTTARDFANPVDYQHPYPSMAQFADHLALSYDANRTRHSYYRQVRLIHQHLGCDPATITEAQLRDYFLFVKLQKHWKPKSIRQALAAASMFFVKLLQHEDWTLFSQIRTKDHDTLPAVLTRQQVHDLLAHIRLRRYRHSAQAHLLLRAASERMSRADYPRHQRPREQALYSQQQGPPGPGRATGLRHV